MNSNINNLSYDIPKEYVACYDEKTKKLTVFKNANDIIEECIDKIAIVKLSGNIFKKSPLVELKDSCDYEKIELYSKETFKFLLENKFISHNFTPTRGQNWLLSHLVQYERDLPDDLLEYIYETGSYNIKGYLTLVNNLNIAKWLLKKGASLEITNGYGESPKYFWELKGKEELIKEFYEGGVLNV